ncbi:MAG: hypothetical protein LBH14_03750 [Desulfobulbaceae bacterium]|jgi:hypothetical protein|nr:hypothetical protein [Desulfobulbaceae bacterium]
MAAAYNIMEFTLMGMAGMGMSVLTATDIILITGVISASLLAVFSIYCINWHCSLIIPLIYSILIMLMLMLMNMDNSLFASIHEGDEFSLALAIRDYSLLLGRIIMAIFGFAGSYLLWRVGKKASTAQPTEIVAA